MKINIYMQIYGILDESYGKQGWWPVTPEGEFAPKYGVSNHNEKQKLEIIISSVLTQNTQWKPNVERAIVELNKKGLIDVNKILDAKHEVLAEAIKSAGYFNQKAKKLKNVAAFLKGHPIKGLERMDLWQARELLLGVNGIGPETADSILLYALNRPVFVIDAYTKRIFSRIGICRHDIKYDDLQEQFMRNVEHSAALFSQYHALIVEHAKQYCKKTPICENCPLSGICSKNFK